ncbi:MAG: hypothetical protein JXB47_08700 [Anaerolineae bacterium]|nr:hypothetical protein [Anaerolineae bacterium]
MKKASFLSVVGVTLLGLALVFVLPPQATTAQPAAPSEGCAAINGYEGYYTAGFVMPAYEYAAGETIVLFAELDNATWANFQMEMPSGTAQSGVISLVDPGTTEGEVVYELPADGTFDIKVNVATDDTVLFGFECESAWLDSDEEEEGVSPVPRWIDNPLVLRAGLRDFASYSHIDDPNLQGGFFIVSDMGGGVLEYGYWKPKLGYVILGWSWLDGGNRVFGAAPDSPLTTEQLELVVRIHEPHLDENW